MYIGKNLTLLNTDLEKFLDELDINMTLDINDTPFTKNIGIITNFNKNTYQETLEFISQQVQHFIKSNNYSDKASLVRVDYDSINNIFNIFINFDEELASLSINGGG